MSKAKAELLLELFGRKFDKALGPLTPLGQELITLENCSTRREKIERVMRRKLGKDWHDQHTGRYRVATICYWSASTGSEN